MLLRGTLIQSPRVFPGGLFVRACLLLISMFACSAVARADAQGGGADAELPSAEMLEFLGELEPLDEETWQLLEHHALEDVAQNEEVNSE